MLKVGITGGIGSGKSVVCRVFTALGIPVFNADNAAGHLLETDEQVKEKVKALLGNESYKGNRPDKAYIASIVFKDPGKLNSLNAIIHPATIAYGNKWMQQQAGPYIIKEAAIFFESGSYKDMDVMVGISAPKELRIQRVLTRPGSTREEILARMAQQMDEEEKMDRCDHVIINDGQQAIIPQVLKLHRLFLESAG
ncbi:MAG: dephospho-CoA kinase [Bacteroidetes bacterium 46-16]|nr:MAG: dephospho-CoA kinase [Bacteroidetes bacterium 46-16]